MSSRRKCDKRHISFLTSIYREGTTQKVCSFALHILRQERLHCIPRKLDMCGGCCDALLASEMGQKHALPLRRSIAVRFTPINGHQCEGRSGRCVWTPGQA
jgi:hypothetical protein